MRNALHLLFLLIAFKAVAQPNYTLKTIASENVYVASTGEVYNPFSTNQRDRIVREVELPAGTVSYTFRVTVSEKGTRPQETLIDGMTKIGTPTFMAAGAVAGLFSFSDGNYTDVYTFSDWDNAQKFEKKIEGWRACKAYKQTTSTCRVNNDCMDMVAFGFRNNNGLTGVNVYFELVALVDDSKQGISVQVHDDIYNNCLKQGDLNNIPDEKRGQFCNCLADRLAAQQGVMSNSNDAAIQEVAKQVAFECMKEIKLVTKNELEDVLFAEDIDNIESLSGKSGVIKYCEEKLGEGLTKDFVYNTLGWNCLLTKQFTKACYYLKEGTEKYPLNLYIKGNYAHALLLAGKTEDAFAIYKMHLNENIDEKMSWKEMITQDFGEFEGLGIVCDKFEEVLSWTK